MQNSFNLKTLNTEASFPLGNDGKPFVLEGDFCMLTQELVKSYFRYENGILIWIKADSNVARIGERAGYYDNSLNRWKIGFLKKRYYEYVLIWVYHNGEIPKGFCIDHKDVDPMNNKIENLRLSTIAQNNWNKPINRNINTSGYKGVVIRSGNISARISKDKKVIYLGSFRTKELAAQAYNEAAIKYYGKFASLNEIL